MNIYMKLNYYIYLKMMTPMSNAMNIDPLKDIKYQEDTSLLEKIDESDKQMLGYVARLYEALNGEKLDFTKINNAVDALQAYNSKNEYRYLNNLLHPEKCKGVKIPSQIPVPSCSFQLHNCITVRTNSSGNLAMMFNPFFLGKTPDSDKIPNGNIHVPGSELTYNYNLGYEFLTSFFINNDDSLIGNTPNDKWSNVNIGQLIPAVYDQYRLVSASVVVKYIGRLDYTSGVIGGSVVFDETTQIGGRFIEEFQADEGGAVTKATHNNIPEFLNKYGNFDLAMDAFYHQENLCLQGMRCLYFPVDPSYEEYTRLMNPNLIQVSGKLGVLNSYKAVSDENYLKNGFNNFIYVLGAPANTACFKIDIYCNFECLPSSSFLNYLPLSMSTDFVSGEQKRRAALIVQQTPIGKAEDENKDAPPAGGESPGILQKLKKKFMDGMPNILKSAGNLLIQSIPGLELGRALANSMQIIAGQTPS